MYSAGTMLSSRCRLIMDGREVEGQDAVMEVLEELMMQEDVAVVRYARTSFRLITSI